jgi:DNA end-binding protein Ku
MTPRAIWKGSISFGLVTIPIGLVSAVESRDELAFHLLHRKDGSRIVQKRFCKAEDVEVPWKEIEKGYEYAKGKYVVITDEEFEKARVPATRTFEVRAFVDANEVPDLYFDYPYYVAPDGRGGVKAYALLRDALGDTGKLAIGTIVLRQREHLAALESYERALVLTTMRFAHEIRTPKELDVPARHKGWTEKEMQLTRQLMDTLTGSWNPHEFRDTYTEVLRRVIAAKAKGKEVVGPEAPKRPRVANLMQALQRSLREQPRPLAKAPGRRAGSRRPARGGRRKVAA